MAGIKRSAIHRRQHRRRKAAKARIKLYEGGKLKFQELPALAKQMVRRKNRNTAA